MRIGVVGLGTTGIEAVRQLPPGAEIVVYDADRGRVDHVRSAADVPRFDERRSIPLDVDVVILAGPVGTHLDAARHALEAGVDVVSISDDVDEVAGLLALDAVARASAQRLVVGAGCAPGLTCLLARHAAAGFDRVEEIDVAKSATGGPACARQHHRAMKDDASLWLDGAWVRRRGGSGRDLAWFPPPIGALDCYRAALPSPLLLRRAFPDAARITARMSATRRDRLTSRLPMLRPPHDDGGPGAVRVEVRGHRGSAFATSILAATGRPARIAGAVSAAVAERLASAGSSAWLSPGACGLAEVDDAGVLAAEVRRRGVTIWTFDGSGPGPS